MFRANRYIRRVSIGVSKPSIHGSSRIQKYSTQNILSDELRGPNRPGLKVQVGDKLSGFTVQAIDECTDYNVTAVRMVHDKTGCGYVHVDSSDTNNVFGIAVRTPPPDSSGVPHILEHCVLCGSEEFPVRDPFFKMLKRSMNNFMNAMTYHDYTVYPFATQNVQDFENLRRVYLDLVLFPNLRENDFLQEGHRLEFDGDTLVRSGVVFNEMKGTLSDAATVFGYKLQESLFPGTLFANNSGGYPKDIPSLTYEALREYHTVHYHPSNALLYTYGDIPLEHHAAQLESSLLHRFQHDQRAATVLGEQQAAIQRVAETFYASGAPPDPAARAGPLRTEQGPVDPVRDIDQQAKFAMSFRLDVDARDSYDLVVLSVLDSLLSTGVTSPVYRALIQTQIAPSYCPGAGLSCSAQFPTLTFGADGIPAAEAGRAEAAVLEAIETAAAEGFEPLRVQAILHQVEAQLRSRKTHFGLEILGGYCRRWMQDGLTRPVVQNPSEIVDRLQREMAEDPEFWQKQVRRHLLVNGYQRLLMVPDPAFVARAEQDERAAVEAARSGLGREEAAAIRAATAVLAEERDAEQDLRCLPTLTLADVARTSPNHTPVEQLRPTLEGGREVAVWWPSKVDMNGLVSLTVDFDTAAVSPELVPLVPLLCTLLGEVSTSRRHFHDLALQRDVFLSSFSLSPFASPWLGPPEAAPGRLLQNSAPGAFPFRQGARVFVGCLDRFLPEALAVVQEVLTESRFADDREHFRGLLKMVAMNASSSLTQDASGFSRLLAALPLGGEGAQRRELSDGITSVMLAQRLAELDGPALDQLARCLDTLCRQVFRQESVAMFVSGGSGSAAGEDRGGFRELIQDRVVDFTAGLGREAPGLAGHVPEAPDTRHQENQRGQSYYVGLPVPVHYCTAYVPTEATFRSAEDYVDMSVLSELVGLSLHRDIREKGGAYGAFCANTAEGNLVLQSYYDPNTEETLRAFSKGIDSVVQGRFSEEQVQESLLSILSKSDSPRLPQRMGFEQFSEGLQPEDRQKVRDRFFSVKKQDIVNLAERTLGHIDGEYFIRGVQDRKSEPNSASVCIFGSLESGEQLFQGRSGWKYEDLTKQ